MISSASELRLEHAVGILVENFCLRFDDPATPQQEGKAATERHPACVNTCQRQQSSVWRGQHHYKTCRRTAAWLTIKNRSMQLFSQTKCEYRHSPHLLPGVSSGTKRKGLQLLEHRFFFEDRANKSSGLWQTALHRSPFLLSLFHMTSQSWRFFPLLFLSGLYIFVPNYFFSSSYNKRVGCRSCWDSRKCALQNIPSHASDMHICLRVSIATF